LFRYDIFIVQCPGVYFFTGHSVAHKVKNSNVYGLFSFHFLLLFSNVYFVRFSC